MLLKLIYFAHGWHLAATGKPLIRNRFEAWKYGPVVRCVYEQFKSFKDGPIGTLAKIFSFSANDWVEATAEFSAAEADHMDHVYAYYRKFSATQLSWMTHEKDTPWRDVWEESRNSIRLGMTIGDDRILQYFRRLKANPN